MRTAVRTFRLTHTVIDQLAQEAERRNSTLVDIVRIAITEYFEHRQTEAALLSLEQRLYARIDAHTQRLSTDLQKILSLAQPI